MSNYFDDKNETPAKLGKKCRTLEVDDDDYQPRPQPKPVEALH